MAELVVINDDNYLEHVAPIVDGERKGHGYIPRDYWTHPVGCMRHVKAFDLPLIPENEWEDRLAAQKASKARLSDIRARGMNGQPIPSLDQDGIGYCWCHGPVSAMLLMRAQAGLPFADLSPFAVGCLIKNYRDEGGWGIEAMEFIATRGVPTTEFWPHRAMNRSHDNPATWENAKLHVNTEWMDLQPRNVEQMITCLLSGFAICAGFNWWSHEICICDLESINPLKAKIWNSWGESWSENGMGILEGNKAIGDGWEAIRVVSPSTK